MPPKNPPPRSIQELDAAAQRFLEGGRYKDAIAALKDGLKRERSREREEKLAEAYLGRAREVAAKGMFQEAAMLWENHAGFHPGLPVTAEYLGWLLQAGQTAKLIKALTAAPATLLEGSAGRGLLESLALLALDHPALLAALPKEHPVTGQQALLRQAILAYAAGRDEDVEACLRQVSSRSPYRNLATLLKGLLLWERDRPAAEALLARVEPDSACLTVASALREPLDIAAPLPLGPRLQAAIDPLRGGDKSQRALLRELRLAGQAKKPLKLLELVLRHRAEFGESLSRRYALALLTGCPSAIPLYERAFGALSPFDQCRFKALHAEQQQDYPQACDDWYECINTLKRAPAGQQELLSQALIYRRMAELAEHDVPDLAIEHLSHSVDLDPADKPTYLKLISLNERQQQLKAAQTWVERALQQFPGDPEVLVLAMQSAQRRKAFKQVAAHARTLLDIDPINSQARRYLLEAHLAHARKLLKTQRTEGAEKELTAARKLDPQRRNPALPYLEGVLAYLRADNEHCRVLWREGWKLAGGGAEAWLRWAMEVLGAGLPLTGPGKLLDGLDKKYVAGKAELAGLAKLIAAHAGDNRKNLGLALKTLAPVLKRSYKQAGLGNDDYANFCQSLAEAAQWELLADCAKQGLKVSVYAPLFQYYQVLAACRGDPLRLSLFEENRLHFAASMAFDAGDRRASAMIEGFLRRRDALLQAEAEQDFDFPDLDPAVEQELRGRLEALEKMSPEEQVQQLMGKLSPADLKNLTPDNLIEVMFGQLLDGTPIDLDDVRGGLPMPGGPRRKSGKQR